MGWRKILKEDIVRGTVIRMTTMIESGSYGMATIIAVRDEDPNYKHIMVARPYAYAAEHYNARSALLGAECYDISIERLLAPASDYEVFQGRDGNTTMVT